MGWPYLSHSVPQGQDQPPQSIWRRLAGLRKRGAGAPQVGQATGWGLMPHLPDLGQKRRTSRAAAQPATAAKRIPMMGSSAMPGGDLGWVSRRGRRGIRPRA